MYEWKITTKLPNQKQSKQYREHFLYLAPLKFAALGYSPVRLFIKWGLSYTYSSLKYRFWENVNKVGPVAFAQVLGPHNDDDNHLQNNFCYLFQLNEIHLQT